MRRPGRGLRAAGRGLAAAGTLALAAACGDAPAVTACEPAAGITPVCGFEDPEDLALLPGGRWLVVSELGRRGSAGRLVAWRRADGETAPLWPGGFEAPAPGWGDPDCPGPPDPAVFAPHGVDTLERERGEPGLLVVNHGGRESVEFFEVGAAGGRPALFWRGCAVLPAETWPNDVAALPGGRGFVVTKMMAEGPEGGPSFGLVVDLLLGRPTGHVWEWTPGDGWRAVPGSEGAMPNGVEVSADGARLFVGMTYSRTLVALDRADGADRRAVDVPVGADNLTWTDGGELLVAGATSSPTRSLRCTAVTEGTCGLPFAVVAVEPRSLETRTVLAGDGEAAFGAASVALQAGDRLYLGTFAGDRLAHAPWPAAGG